jgi:ligand-binding sensor domain-containing protein/putative methionine-R-sulfoxide reductase with GAF domain
MSTRLVFLLLLSFFVQASSGQSRYNFFTMGSEQGLSSDDVWAINQDKYGFIWIGTANGLNRYDGHTIKKYFHSDADKYSIAANIVYWIFRDSDGDMWFACGAGGMSRYNYAKDRFESLTPYDSARKFNKFNGPVWRFGEDNRKRIYLSSGETAFRYDKRTGKFEDLKALFNNELEGGIGRFLMDRVNKDIMWIAADNGLFRYDLAKEKIVKVSYDEEKLAYGRPGFYDIEWINDFELIASLEKAAYLVFDTRTLKARPAEPAYDPAISKRFTQMAEILKDSRGRVWIANSADGLLEFNTTTRTSYSMKKELLYPYPFAEQEGAGKSIFEDRDGNIWYATSNKGVLWFQPQLTFLSSWQRNYADKSSLPNNRISSFWPTPSGEMFIGTDAGLTRLNRQTGKFYNYPVAVTDKDSYPFTWIHEMIQCGDTLYISTGNGLSLLNLRTEQFSRYRHDPNDSGSLFAGNAWLLACTMPGELIVTGDLEIGRFNRNTGRFSGKRQNANGDSLYNYTNVNYIVHDAARKKLWLEGHAGNLYEYDLVTRKSVRHFFTEDTTINTITTMKMDENGHLWIGTPAGLISYDPATKTSRKIALPTSSQQVTNLHISQHSTWITTAKELIRFNRATGKTEIVDLRTMLPRAGVFTRAMTMDQKGDLWIGTNKGFFIVDTAGFRGQEPVRKPQLVSFTVFDKEKSFEQTFNALDKIVLNYQENFFSFSFSSFNYQRSQNIQYAYKLEGFDKDWNYTTANTASYTNVPPGRFTLMVKASNGTGDWQEMTQPIHIRIKPPFWLSWPFITLSLLVLMTILVWLYFRKKKQLRKQKIDNTIDYFANSVYGENSVNEICWDIARNCISQLQFEDCVVYLLDENTGRMVQKAAYGPKNPKGHEITNPIEIEPGTGIVGAAALTGKPVLVNDTSKDTRYIIDDEARYSELAVPVLHDGKVIGVIDSEHPKKNFFTEEHVKALSTIASISANKIAEAQAEAYAKENELKLLNINKQLAESQLMALRAQMNPHFVFNCLNSIQECIVTQKYGEASNYLNKFSKLFRTVLNNSGKNLVTIDEEKEVLKLYLELELMRFDQSFQYEIRVDEDLETEEILMPSMLLQPYVENALWHGLMHKEGERKLQIDFSKVSEDVFRCVIDDNGIGRERSFQLKEQQSKTKRHESKGLKITKDRIEILRKQGYHATLDIVDKTNAAGGADGTRVIVELSTFLKPV